MDLDHLVKTAMNQNEEFILVSKDGAKNKKLKKIIAKFSGETYLYRCEYGRHIVCRTPSILQYVQTNATVCVYVWMEHFGNKPYRRRLIWIFFSEFYSQLESTIFEWSVMWPKYNSIPNHDIVVGGCTRNTSGWIFL